MLRDWTDSLRMEGISAESERLFVRLIMRADDYGRFHGDPRLIKANCFPLCDEITVNQIAAWLDEVCARGLIVIYSAGGRRLLAIANYGQRLRTSRAKFLPMDGMGSDWLPDFETLHQLPAPCQPLADNCPPLPATSRNPPPEEKGSRREVELETEDENEHEADCGKPAVPVGTYSDFVELLWSIFPKIGRERSSKLKTSDQWKKTKTKPSEETVLHSVKKWELCDGWKSGFIPGVHVWLKDRKWEDDPEPAKSTLEKQTLFDESYEKIES